MLYFSIFLKPKGNQYTNMEFYTIYPPGGEENKKSKTHGTTFSPNSLFKKVQNFAIRFL